MSGDEQARSRRAAILAEYAEEEAEAAEIEVAENAAALDVPLNLRITKGLPLAGEDRPGRRVPRGRRATSTASSAHSVARC